MFETWLELDQRPFGAAPFAGHYFAAEAIDAARAAIHRCVERGTGPAIVIGPAGSGKSMLSLVLQHEICPLTPFALVSGGELHSRREMLQSLLYEFGLPYRGDQESELRLTLLDFFTSRDASQRASVLVVDDAHFLSPELLHDLANLSSHARDGNWCLQLVLLGTLRLEELLTNPSLASFQQRIASRSYLTNWTLAETTEYIHGQVQPLSEKWNEFPTLSEPVCRKVYEFTSGTPRLVNQLCEHVLMTVLVTGQGTVTVEEVERAWYDVQHLPSPSHLSSRLASQGSQSSPQSPQSPRSPHATAGSDQDLIEFGELLDDDNCPTTPYRVTEIQAKLDQVQDGLDFIVNEESDAPDVSTQAFPIRDFPSRESASLEVQTAQTIRMEWPVVTTANDPFAEQFAEEVLVLIPAPIPPENPRTGIGVGARPAAPRPSALPRTGIVEATVSGQPVDPVGAAPGVGTAPAWGTPLVRETAAIPAVAGVSAAGGAPAVAGISAVAGGESAVAGVSAVGTTPDFQSAPSSTVRFVDATDGLAGSGGPSFRDAMALLAANFDSFAGERPSEPASGRPAERAIAPVTGRRYRHLFSRLSQGA